ncbi:MAG: hypothetical protein ACYDH5_13265, partial [Acidimicrobiales bacterium]
AATTSHRVQVPDGMPEQLGAGPGGDEKLLRATFAFLLQREPATSILGEFSLDDVKHYYPDFPERMRIELSSG